jgi:hypothetical protein
MMKFLKRGGIASKNVHENLVDVYMDYVPSKNSLMRWIVEFTRGRESIEDNPPSERLVKAKIHKNCVAI